jgi:hypothetical protein
LEVAVPWDFIIAMPAVSLPRAVDAGNTAVVPFSDPRYVELSDAQPRIRRFLESFRTAFGHQLQPAIVIRDRSAERIQAEDLAALRNMIALAAVVRARTDRSVHRFGGEGPVYADLFELYPVNMAVDAETVTVRTASEFGLDDDLEHFQGQPDPAYIYPQNVTPKLDEVILESLLGLWQSHAAGEDQERFRRRIFRSLETAYHALGSPFLNLGSQYDHALSLSLWVSAFEILVTRAGNVSASDVERLITRVRWSHPALRSDVVESPRGPRPGRPVSRPVQAYERLYKVRNESLHGGVISADLVGHRLDTDEEDALEPAPLGLHEWNHLALAVPALYRAVLLELLTRQAFHTYPADPGVDDLDAYAEYLDAQEDYEYYETPLLFRSRLRR